MTRKLAAQARTRHELERVLRRQQVPEEVARDVLDRFGEVGLVDDAQFARDWVESRRVRRGLSRRALQRELQGRGVDRDAIDEALAPVGREEELAAARALAQRKLRSMAGLDPQVRHRRLAGALARRGFGGSLVSRVLGELATPDPDPATDAGPHA